MARKGQRRVHEGREPEDQDPESRVMERSIVLSLTDEELQDLYRILIDRDAAEALRFLDQHARKKVLQALEGG